MAGSHPGIARPYYPGLSNHPTSDFGCLIEQANFHQSRCWNSVVGKGKGGEVKIWVYPNLIENYLKRYTFLVGHADMSQIISECL